MKLNNTHNIITDEDITITGDNNILGNTLSDVIHSHEESINKLKSNVKWLYKYGGVGSGSGGSGSGGVGKWGFTAFIGGKKVEDGQTIPLDGAGIYLLSVTISKAGGAQFGLVISYEGSESITTSLSADNSWTYITNLQLKKNSRLTITINDGNEPKSVSITYITNPYRFEKIRLLYPDDSNSGNGDIFIGNIKNNGGIKASINYNISISNAIVKYNWEFNGNKTEDFEIPSSDKSGNIEYWLFNEENLDTLTENMAGPYSVKSNIIISLENQEPTIISDSFDFNLVPETLYLRVTPESGYVFSEIPENIEEDDLLTKAYYTNSTITFILKAFFGTNQNRNINVRYKIYNSVDSGWDDGNEKTISFKENVDTPIQFSFSNTGWKKIQLICSYGSNQYSIIKYVYIKEVITNFNWYNDLTPTNTSYWRLGQIDNSNALSELSGLTHYQVNSTNNGNKLIPLNTPDASQVGDFLISIGIQYCEINNTQNPILSINYTDGSNQEPFITVYQNKIIIDDKTINIFLGKTAVSSYSINNKRGYHLLQILFKYSNTYNSLDYRQACVYLDGVLEGAAESWFSYTKALSSISLNPSNYILNLLEVSNFPNGGKAVENSYFLLEDVDICYYYYTYLIKSTNEISSVSNNEINILNELFNTNAGRTGNKVSYSLEENLLKLTKGSSTISNISKNLKIPTLVINTSESPEGGYKFFDWINNSYEEESTAPEKKYKYPVSLRWYNDPSGEGSGISFSSSDLIDGNTAFGDSNIGFYIELQGSSTMRFKSKNLTLGVKYNTEGADKTPLFSPNFNVEDTSTFLPDTAFTLKADMVDSSHTNNTCLGKFINEVYSSYNINSYKKESSGDLIDHIKSCLEGFPIIIFIELLRDNNKTEYYYLGIYNFNLGRNNLLNLGYINPYNIQETLKSSTADSGYQSAGIKNFLYTKVDNDKYRAFNNLVVAEIQGNSPFWDFSQYDGSILFQKDNKDVNYMFGDIVYGNSTGYDNSIKSFTKSITNAGYYVFNEINKTFENLVKEDGTTNTNAAYKQSNIVPNASVQYSRSDSNTYSIINGEGPSESMSNYGSSLLSDCILDNTEDMETKIAPLDYTSAVLYYTLCMAFGLVDSVQKNLNIKTWDRLKYGLYFYDMDTSLGTSNSGTDTSYFCFSDYWETAFSDTKDVDETGKIIVKNDGITNHRDIYPTHNSEGIKLPAGYDIPSTYLFAIVKYAGAFSQSLSASITFPQQVWGELRQVNGKLENADKFIDNYFKKHLSDVPITLLNLNYRVKYLYTATNKDIPTNNKNTAFGSDCGSLRGRKIEKVRDWLNSRFHILDAYFNLVGVKTIIYEETHIDDDGNTVTDKSYSEPICNVSNLTSNTDIQVLHDIFSPVDASGNVTTLNRVGELEFDVRGRNYTPIVHRNANTITRYLLEDENTTYRIKVHYDGNQTSKFGGSAGWTYLNSINPFIETLETKTDFTINSDKLELIKGTSGSLTNSANFTIPSTKKLILTSPNYDCAVEIDDTFYNLDEVDIRNSKIKLTANEATFSKLIATGINSSRIELNNCEKLNDISISGTIGELIITPLWRTDGNTYTFIGGSEGIEVSKLTLRGNNSNLVIQGMTNLEELTFDNFKTVTISGCSNLKKVVNNDVNSVITSLIINDTANITEISLIADELITLDLSRCSVLNNLSLFSTNQTLDKLTTLKLDSTSIKTIQYYIRPEAGTSATLKTRNTINDYISSENLTAISDDNILFLEDYPNLSTFSIKGNTSVEYIKVSNDKNNPFILKSDIFSSCDKLKRIFGHLGINNINAINNLFKNCYKFSIHGYYIKDTTIGSEINSLKINNVEICDSYGKVKHPTELEDSLFNDDYFLTGDNVTNISYIPSNSGGNNNLTSAFHNTSCTIFDIYYFLKILSNSIKNNPNEFNSSANIYLSSLFYIESPNKIFGPALKFSWWIDETSGTEIDNSPNRHIFDEYLGPKIYNLTNSFRTRIDSNSIVRLFSTTLKIINSSEEDVSDIKNNCFLLDEITATISNDYSKVNFNGNNYNINNKEFTINGKTYKISIKDRGLFYYITNSISLSTIFYNGNYIVDNNIFINKTYWEDTNFSDGANFKEISYFSPKHIIAGIDYLNYTSVFSNEIVTNFDLKPEMFLNNSVGDISRILKPVPKLTKISNVFNGTTTFIDFDKSIDIGIHPYVRVGTEDEEETITYRSFYHSFRPSYAAGEINLNRIFNFSSSTPISNYKRFLQSFDSRYRFENYSNGYSTLKSDRPNLINANIILSNDTFSKFNSLINIGYTPTGSDLPGLTSEYSSFYNLDKKIINEFPYKIIEHLINLETFSGVFHNCTVEFDTNTLLREIELPGDLFKYNTGLRNISRCFENFNYKIKLTSGGFINCTNLNDVSYLFKNKNTSNRKDIGIFGMIPNKLFYHGSKSTSITKTTKGTNYVKIIDDVEYDAFNSKYYREVDNEKWIYNSGDYNDTTKKLIINPLCITSYYTREDEESEFIINTTQQAGKYDWYFDDENILEEKSITYYEVNTNINNMDSCFYGQGFITEYKIDSENEKQNLLKEEINNNIDYQPYKYVLNSNSNRWEDMSATYYPYEKTCMWFFDGDYSSWNIDDVNNCIGDVKFIYDNLEDIKYGSESYGVPISHEYGQNGYKDQIITNNYFCPPDLFRYCFPSVSIKSIFSFCGYSIYYPSSLIDDNSFSDGNVSKNINYGISGRICHYLLKPISEITSLAQFIQSCKRLSPYIDKSNNIYLIPKNFLKYTNSIYDFTESFKRLLFPAKCKLNIFDNLISTTYKLVINEVFQYLLFYKTSSDNKADISSVFINNYISEAKRVFSVDSSPSSFSANYVIAKTTQYINFGINFDKNKIPNDSYGNNPSKAVILSVYDGFHKDYVSFGGLTIDSNSNTTTVEFKSHQSDTSKPPYNYRTRGNI